MLELARPIPVVEVPFRRVNFVCLKDIHAAATAPGRRRGSYGDEILAKLRWAGELATQIHGNVLCAGDLFHFKNPQHAGNDIAYVTKLMEALAAYPSSTMFGVIGNHDVRADNMQTLPGQPLGNLIQALVYHRLSTCSLIFEGQDQDGRKVRVRVDGYDYEPDARVIMEAMQTASPDDTCDYRLAVAHAFGGPGKTQPMFGETAIGFDDLTTTPYDAFLWGHDHKPKGVIQVGKQWHLYLGSLSRAALSADEADRPVTVPILSFSSEGIKVLERECPVTPLELAFHTATLEVEKASDRSDVQEQRAATTAFLADLQGQAEAAETDNPLELLHTLTQDADVIKKLCDVCDLH